MKASQRSAGSSKPGRRGVAAVAQQEVVAGVERVGEVEPAVAAARGADRRRRPASTGGAHDRGSAGLVREAAGDEPDDADRPRADGERARRGPGRRRSGCPRRPARAARASPAGPGAWPGSGRPNAARASAIAARIRSRRVLLAVLEHGGQRGRLVGGRGEQEPGGVEGLPHPARGVEPGREDEPDRLEVHARPGARRPAPAGPRCPGRGAVRMRSRPSRAIDRFSPRIGATSETVPIVARSASVERLGLRAGQLAEEQARDRERDARAREPAVRDSATSSRCGLTRATAAGSTSGRWWWSVTMTSIPRPRPRRPPRRSWTRCRRSRSARCRRAPRSRPPPSTGRGPPRGGWGRTGRCPGRAAGTPGRAGRGRSGRRRRSRRTP